MLNWFVVSANFEDVQRSLLTD